MCHRSILFKNSESNKCISVIIEKNSFDQKKILRYDNKINKIYFLYFNAIETQLFWNFNPISFQEKYTFEYYNVSNPAKT